MNCKTVGLDSNQQLFNPLMLEVKRKLAVIRENIDED